MFPGLDDTFPHATELALPALPVMLIPQVPLAPAPVLLGKLVGISVVKATPRHSDQLAAKLSRLLR